MSYSNRHVRSATLLLLVIATACSHGPQSGAASRVGFPATGASGDWRIGITRSGSQPSSKGPSEHFTGSVRRDPLFEAKAPSRAGGPLTTFEPGVAWHTHPLGQNPIATAGIGRIQSWGGPVEGIRSGNVVWIPPGQKHWHGASPNTAIAHIAIVENLDGNVIEWMEKVSDEQYQAGSSLE